MEVAGGEEMQGDGINLLPTLTAKDKNQDGAIEQRGLYWEFGNSQAYRLGDWKLLQFKRKDGIETHLYNLGDDEGETTNLASQLPQQVAFMKNQANASRIKSNEFRSFLDAN